MRVPQEALVVPLTTWAWVVVSGGTTLRLYVRHWLAPQLLTAQPGSLVAIDQLTPGAAGRVSVNETPVAAEPLVLLRATVNPICEP